MGDTLAEEEGDWDETELWAYKGVAIGSCVLCLLGTSVIIVSYLRRRRGNITSLGQVSSRIRDNVRFNLSCFLPARIKLLNNNDDCKRIVFKTPHPLNRTTKLSYSSPPQ